MTALAMLWTDIRILLVDTTKIWWKLLPKILAIFLFGWLGYQLGLEAAVFVGQANAWLALLIFAFSFVSKLVAVVLILRLVGNALGLRGLIPEDEAEQDDRDDGITRLLAVTLLPFLGIYTAFGLVTKASDQMLIEDMYRSGGAFADHTIMSSVRLNGDDVSVWRWVFVLGLIVGTYVVRRSIDIVHERTGFRPLGLVGTFIEAFFVLITLTAGIDVFGQIKFWITDRQFVAWIHTAAETMSSAFVALGINLPAIFTTITDFIGQQVWPIVVSGLSEPIFWLAIAALVYGSSVISVAELWRKGKPLASRVRVARRMLERSAREHERAEESSHKTGLVVATEVKEAFLGDIDDKYMPTLNSLRLILRAGVIFLGAYVLVYALQHVAATAFLLVMNRTVGGHDMSFWIVWLPGFNLLQDLIFEPWRLCLLAVALRRCLEIFRMRAVVAGTLQQQVERPVTAEQVAAADLEAKGRPVPQQVGI
ncbi:hypothetical protein FOE78_01500 [Microlunatus elymi]|uniref:Uncharacterized protein n=1 Tax=Microlunatus elymi TaxID=2596828 RepID=A0A516PU92_9ACTN|nr:hypothetical protein [Microlunatus elymi]QDP94765.1 hypothetical protein FOE78_01500 [Microlunatus elymi]